MKMIGNESDVLDFRGGSPSAKFVRIVRNVCIVRNVRIVCNVRIVGNVCIVRQVCIFRLGRYIG